MARNDAYPMATRRKVLIIKLGYGETLDPDSSGVVSFGDIVRTTVLLHAFPSAQWHVTWLVDPDGLPLLEGISKIDCLVAAVREIPTELRNNEFDVVVNLEKDATICAQAAAMNAGQKYGFRFDETDGQIACHEHGDDAVAMCVDPEFKRQQTRSWSEQLFRVVGQDYAGEPYLFREASGTPARYDVGLNHLVGAKFPHKRWAEPNWQALQRALAPQHSVSWQQGQNNLEDYVNWIACCRVLVTNDSLGLHIAIALGIPVVALFGPTSATEVGDHACLTKLLPAGPAVCDRCDGEVCARARPCMEDISVTDVQLAVVIQLAGGTHLSAAVAE